jgi:hypothetical protein
MRQAVAGSRDAPQPVRRLAQDLVEMTSDAASILAMARDQNRYLLVVCWASCDLTARCDAIVTLTCGCDWLGQVRGESGALADHA